MIDIKKKFVRIKKSNTLSLFVVVNSLLVFSSFIAGCISTDIEQDNSFELVENVSIRIIAPYWTIEYMHVDTNNATVADFLFECAYHYDFTVEAEYWPSYDAIFVEAINGLENGEDGMYWQYYINGEYGNLGADKQPLKNNDIVEWRFEESTF